MIPVMRSLLGTSQMCFCEGLSPLTRPDAVGLCGRTIGYHSFVPSVFPRASDLYLSARASFCKRNVTGLKETVPR